MLLYSLLTLVILIKISMVCHNGKIYNKIPTKHACFPPASHELSFYHSFFAVQSFRNKQPVHVVVDPILCNVLRPHQREVSHFAVMTFLFCVIILKCYELKLNDIFLTKFHFVLFY